MIIETIIPFHELSAQQQVDLVVKLQTIRGGMEIIARRERVRRNSNSASTKRQQLTFASKELEAIFNTYTPEMRKLILGK